MPELLDTAEMLVAIAGDRNAAAAAARDMANECQKGRRRREALFWLDVANTIAASADPAPLVGPHIPATTALRERARKRADRMPPRAAMPKRSKRVRTHRRAKADG